MESIAQRSEGSDDKIKPKFRGSVHAIAFFVILAAGLWVFAVTPKTGELKIALGVYVACMSLMFGISGLYHRPTWSHRARRVLRRADHAGIFLQIAGSYTAFWSLATPESRSVVLLIVMWVGAIGGAITLSTWTDMPRTWRAAVYVVLGLSSAPLIFSLPSVIGLGGTAIILAGAGIYILGALVYARRWPNPNPRVFGYHEVFHVMVVLAAAIQFAVVAQKHLS